MTTRFCLTVPIDPTPREIVRLHLVARTLAERIVCLVGPDPGRWAAVAALADTLGVPFIPWPAVERNGGRAKDLRYDAVISLADSPPNDARPAISASLGTWVFRDGDPRRDRCPTTLERMIADGRPRVAMTLRRLGDTPEHGRVLAFADTPRRPWDSLAALQRRLDAYVPLMIDQAGEATDDPGDVAFATETGDPCGPARNKGRLRERLTDAKFLTHMVFRNLAPVFPKQRSAVLLLHNPPADILDGILATLRKIGPFVPYSRIVSDLKQGRPPTPGFVLTFDDGYKENMALVDVLDRHRCKAMFFLNTAVIDRKSALWFMNPDTDFLARKKYLRSLDYASFLAAADEEGLTSPSPLRGRFGLRSEDVRTLLARGHEIGVHTHNHPFLTRLKDHEIRSEVSECWERLRSISGDRALPFHFAYPDGDHDERVVAVLGEMGAQSAVTTRAAPVDSRSPVLEIPRYQLGDLDYPGLSLFKLTAAFPALNAARRGAWVRRREP